MKENKRKWGDRSDGVWIKDLDGLHLIMPHLMPKRTEAEVYLQEKMDVTRLLKYVNEKNAEGRGYKMTPFHVVVAAVAKTIYFRPYLNRFIAGKRIYQRDEITLSFVVKRTFEDHSDEILYVMKARPETTIFDVSSKISGDSARLRKEPSTDVNDIMNFVGKMPRFLTRLFFVLVRFLDFHGWMPKVITSGDPNYTTVMLSNLGSIKCDAPYHHLNNYGTNSIMITVGEIHKEPVVNEDGELEIRDVVNLGCTADERIADGFYFARSIKFIKYLLANPEILESSMDTEVDYEF
ncbi:MAG: 2-oxo acid dehydrogenase subunit E2 [Bacillota bacterium]|nr:2-oxo acid dehydrogenase subunit E2 [Bacillota bacterium]